MTAVASCTRCGADIPYEPHDEGLLVGLRPTVCRECAERDERLLMEQVAAAEQESRNIPPRYRGATFAGFRATTPSQLLALEAMRDHASEGVLLMGPAGCGKTHLACAAIAAGESGSLFANTAELLDDVRRGYDGDGRGLYERALDAPLLALDDIGAEAVTDWVRDRLYVLINHRWDHCLPLVVTTNVPAAELASRIGQGVASRLAGCCAHRIVVKGPDGRRADLRPGGES